MKEDPFIRAIITEPDDEHLRLVYADWLEEQGDIRADFLRLECQFASISPADPRYPSIESRVVEICKKIDPAWLAKVNRPLTFEFLPAGADQENQWFCPAFQQVISVTLCWECSMADQGGPTDTAAELRRWVAASGRYQSVVEFQAVCADCSHCPWRDPG